MKQTLRQGFTIVELVVVIAVIAILATIVSVMYATVQQQARDTQLRDGANKVAGAIQLFYSKYERLPRGGSGSTVAIGTGTECTDGADEFFGKNVYTCTVEDTLVASGYLPDGFSSKLPKNKLYNPTSTNNLSLMVYTPPAARKVMVYYTMEDQTDEDKTRFDAELTKCGYNPAGIISPRDSWGMRGGICADL